MLSLTAVVTAVAVGIPVLDGSLQSVDIHCGVGAQMLIKQKGMGP